MSMLIDFSAGLNQSKTGDMLGLRNIANSIKAKYPNDFVMMQEWSEDITSNIKLIYGNSSATKIILVGHSFGGSRMVKLANSLSNANIPVFHLVLLDPVPMDGWGILNFVDFKISDNVQNATCFYRSSWFPPYSCKIRKGNCPYVNLKRNWDHNDFPSQPEVAAAIMDIVMLSNK